MRVLILEKNESTAKYVEETLRQVWCESETCAEADQGLCALEQGNFDAVVLGEALSGMDGIAFLGKARKEGCQTPVLMLFSEEFGSGRDRAAESAASERRNAQSDRVQARIRALEAGADYCLNMPVDGSELLAVLKAIDRRRGELLPDRLAVGDLYLDQATYTLSGPDGSLQLGRREFDLIRILMVNRDIVVSKETLLTRVWGERPEAGDNNVEVYISFLRRKIEALGVHVSIVTMRRLGYKLTTG